MTLGDYIPDDPAGTIWDVVVVGTGAGGASAGLSLAKQGHSVLFLERGKLPGVTEGREPAPRIENSVGEVEFSGTATAESSSASARNSPPIVVGAGFGGATAVYAMVMDRFRPEDFEPGSWAEVPNGTSLPQAWPIAYEDLEPYYRQAEALFRVRGTGDPLNSHASVLLEPPTASDTEMAVHGQLVQQGLHPYRIHYAREYVAGCEGCVREACVRGCRNDAGQVCAVPALRYYGAHLLPECLVTRLESSRHRVEAATCVFRGRPISIRARLFVLALNALLTPALLLRSANSFFPDGLGNHSGMVGRNLMLHVSDLITVNFNGLQGPLNGTFRHGLSLNDFYMNNGVKLGNVHAHAIDFTRYLPGPPSWSDERGTVWFNTIMDDFPYPENRVLLGPTPASDVRWIYHYPNELSHRNRLLHEAFRRTLPVASEFSIREPVGLLNGTHTCGTCRFGDDPRRSVLDRSNRIHDLENVYVLDASFFPSGGGINPCLTIVANSLRATATL